MGIWNRIPLGEVCYICGNRAESRERDSEGIDTRRYICKEHYFKNYNRYRYADDMKDSNSFVFFQKATRKVRMGNLDPNSNLGVGNNFEKLSEIYFDIDNLNVINNNYRFPIDHSKHSILGIMQTKGAFFSIDVGAKGGWQIGYRTTEYKKQYDKMICWCASKDGKTIERGYIIPKNEIDKRRSIGIVKDPRTWPVWYEQYRITNEKELKKINEIWKQILVEKGLW